jgi:isoamylase
MRNFLATLLLSQGVPCCLAATSSAEARAATATPIARTTKSAGSTGRAWATKARRCSPSPASSSCFGAHTLSSTAHRFFLGQAIPGTEVKGVVWLRPDGAEMSETDWEHARAKALAVRLSGEPGLMHLTERGEQEPDDTFLILLNASHDDVTFRIAADPAGVSWEVVVDTAAETEAETLQTLAGGGEALVDANSLRLLVRHSELAGRTRRDQGSGL